jgi:hypothetical protein
MLYFKVIDIDVLSCFGLAVSEHWMFHICLEHCPILAQVMALIRKYGI